jgi:hypothetical protein
VTLAELEREFAAELPRGWRRRARADRARVRAEERAARAAAKAARPVPMWRTLRMHLPGWICAAAPAIYQLPDSAAGHIHELRRLLADPEMQALLRQSRYLGDSLKRICRGLAMDLSVLYPAPEVAAAPVEAAPEPLDPTPGEIVSAATLSAAPPSAAPPSAAPPSAAIAAPDEKNHFPGAAGVPTPPRVAGEMTSSEALPCGPSIGGYFAPD